jgi:hypothetical protein
MAVVLQAEKVAKKMKGNAVSGYSNDSNPFGDPNLTEKYANSFPTSDTLGITLVVEFGFAIRNLGWHMFGAVRLLCFFDALNPSPR